jgi:hypothetical protein
VDPVAFETVTVRRTVVLRWQMADVCDVVGFNVYRSESETAVLERVNTATIRAEGTGAARFELRDPGTSPEQSCAYWLEIIDALGRSRILGPFRYPSHATSPIGVTS